MEENCNEWARWQGQDGAPTTERPTARPHRSDQPTVTGTPTPAASRTSPFRYSTDPATAGVVGTAESDLRAVRRPDRSSGLSLFPLLYLLPLSLLCASPFAALLAAFTPVPPTGWLLVYLALGGLLFVRAVEERVGQWYFKVRRPSSHELQMLRPAWDTVMHRAGIPSNRYLLRVQDTADLNASAAAGHIITVTSTACELPQPELQAVIAHELGHHLGLHSAVATVTNWLILPINAFLWLGSVLAKLMQGIARVASVFRNTPLSLVATLFVLTARLSLLAIGLFAQLAALALSGVARLGEYAADDAAVELGFGRGLHSALCRFRDLDGPAPARPNIRQVLASSHPPIDKRLARVAKTFRS